jgi:poly(A) polymerase
MDIVAQLMGIAKGIQSSNAEKEVERLLKIVLRGTIFSNKVMAVGGYVRDEVLGLDAKDLDIVVDMKDGAEKVTRYLYGLFSGSISTPRRLGAGYPIWQITFKEDVEHKGNIFKTEGAVIEFADAQKESFPDADSRQRVTEPGNIEEDVKRRDFTVNMLLKDLTTGELLDLTGTSINDIKNGILRGHPGVDFDKILSDDPLRMMRLIRFQAKYGWTVPMWVLKAMKRNASRIGIVSGERIRDELIKIMNIGKLGQAVKFMKSVGLLQYVLPEIQAMNGVEHEYSKGTHLEGDVFQHSLKVLQNAKPGVENQLAALLHDVGKPASQEVIGGLIRFIGHEKVSGEIAEAILRRLKFDGAVIKKVRTMVENHMRPHSLSRGDAGPTGLRKFIREVGVELVDSILDLAQADSLGTIPPRNLIPDLRKEIDILMAPVQKAEVLPIDGKEIQQILGIGPGKLIGDILKYLKDKQFEFIQSGKEMTKEDAKKIVLDHFGH